MIIEALRQHITQNEIAMRLGVSPKTVSAWKARGVAWPKRDAIKRICLEFGINPDELSFGPSEKQ